MPRYSIQNDQWVPDNTMERLAPPWTNDHQWFSGLGASTDRRVDRFTRPQLRGLGELNEWLSLAGLVGAGVGATAAWGAGGSVGKGALWGGGLAAAALLLAFRGQ